MGMACGGLLVCILVGLFPPISHEFFPHPVAVYPFLNDGYDSGMIPKDFMRV